MEAKPRVVAESGERDAGRAAKDDTRSSGDFGCWGQGNIACKTDDGGIGGAVAVGLCSATIGGYGSRTIFVGIHVAADHWATFVAALD